MDLGESRNLHRLPSVQHGKRLTLTPQLNCRQKPMDRAHEYMLDKTYRFRLGEQPALDLRHFPMSESLILNYTGNYYVKNT